MQRITHKGAVVSVPLNEWTGFSCPECGDDDVQAWADDGEAWAADWWECGECKSSGALLAPEGLKTQNGVELVTKEGRG